MFRAACNVSLKSGIQLTTFTPIYSLENSSVWWLWFFSMFDIFSRFWTTHCFHFSCICNKAHTWSQKSHKVCILIFISCRLYCKMIFEMGTEVHPMLPTSTQFRFRFFLQQHITTQNGASNKYLFLNNNNQLHSGLGLRLHLNPMQDFHQSYAT